MSRSTLAIGVILAGLLSTSIAASSADSAPTPVSARFLERPPETLRRFRAARHLEAENTRFNKRGWVDVCTELAADGGFSVDVLAEGGSAYIRRKVLRPVLDGERDLIGRGGASQSALTTLNYTFTDEAPVETGLVRLESSHFGAR